MRRLLFTLLSALLNITAIWAQTSVSTEDALRAAVQTDEANIKFTADIEIGSLIEITGSRTVTIDMDGHILNRGLAGRGVAGQVFAVRSGATLNLSNGTLTGGWGGDSGGINNYGTTNLSNVVITGCTGDDRGGGICNHESSTLTMVGGAIANNKSNDHTTPEGGGGIFNAYGATSTLDNVVITGNEAMVKGGGGICNYGAMTLNECVITNNRAHLNGGGIWNGAIGSGKYPALLINGGTITGNTAVENGGGIYVGSAIGDHDHTFLRMQGAINVTGNTGDGGLADNVFLKFRKYIRVSGSLAGSNIGITMETTPYEFTKDFNTYNTDVDPATIFHPDWSDIMVIVANMYKEAYQNYKTPGGTLWYLEHGWDAERKELTATFKYLTEQIDFNATPTSESQYKVLTSTGDAMVEMGTENSEIHEFYIVNSDVELSSLNVRGPNVHLVLCDNSTLTFSGDIVVSEGHTLYIHDQGSGSTQGKIRSTDDGSSCSIGGVADDTNSFGGNIEIHGGDIYIVGMGSGSAIGGDYGGGIGNISIFGGKIYAEGSVGAAGIGGGLADDNYGNINIYGGDIQAVGGSHYPDPGNPGGGAGIGAGYGCRNGNLHIYGGTINASAKGESAGIGCGQNTNHSDYGAGTIVIDGGTIVARGGNYAAGIGGGDGIQGANLTINGGSVEAYGGTDAAGIGGGEGGDGHIVVINGGYVYAEGGWEYGAGIGGGQDGAGADVTINGGTVVAKSGNLGVSGMRGIGPGGGSDSYGTLNIADEMMVSSWNGGAGPFPADQRKSYCWNHTQARIGPCIHQGHTYTISGTTSDDTHTEVCAYCTTPFEEEKHNFVSGTCTVCGVGATAYDLRTYLPKDDGGTYDGKTYESKTDKVIPDATYFLPACTTTVPGLEFRGWEESTVSDDTYESDYTTTGGTIYEAGAEYTITGDVSFIARYNALDIVLEDDAFNSFTLLKYGGMTANSVTLNNRVLRKNGCWNTLCLPFALSAEQLAASTLAGATLMELDVNGTYDTDKQTGFDPETGTLYLYFKDASSIEAGKPYIIRWSSGSDIESPVFNGITINNVLQGVHSQDGRVSFGGVYNPRSLEAGDKTTYYFGSDNNIYYPSEATTLNAFRNFIKLSGIDANQLNKIVTKFEETTGVASVQGSRFKVQGDAYNLAGQRVGDGYKGMVIKNGKTYLKP